MTITLAEQAAEMLKKLGRQYRYAVTFIIADDDGEEDTETLYCEDIHAVWSCVQVNKAGSQVMLRNMFYTGDWFLESMQFSQ